MGKLFPQASSIIGIDLSPYMLAIGTFLLKEVAEKKVDDELNSNSYFSILENENNVEKKEVIEVESNARIGKNIEKNTKKKFEWVDEIEEDDRISFSYNDMANTGIESGTLN